MYTYGSLLNTVFSIHKAFMGLERGGCLSWMVREVPLPRMASAPLRESVNNLRVFSLIVSQYSLKLQVLIEIRKVIENEILLIRRS